MPQTQIYTQLAQVHLVVEATVDTHVVPTDNGANMFLAEIPDVPLTLEGENYRPNYTRSDFLNMDEVPGPMTGSLNFRVPLKGSGSAGTAPEFSTALLACAMRQSIVAATSVSYYPWHLFAGATDAGPPATTDPGQSYSVNILENGVRWSIKGAFGTFTLSAEVGQPAFLDFTFTGAYVAVVDDALETGMSYNATTAPSFLGASISTNFGAPYTPKGVESFSIDKGNEIAVGRDANESSGVYGARVGKPTTVGTYTPEMDLVANEDFFGNQRAGTAGTFTTGQVGSAAGNYWTVNANRIVLRPISLVNRNNIRALEVPFSVGSQTTDVAGTNVDLELKFE